MTFLNQKLQEELLKRNTQLASMETKLREMKETMFSLEVEEAHRKKSERSDYGKSEFEYKEKVR